MVQNFRCRTVLKKDFSKYRLCRTWFNVGASQQLPTLVIALDPANLYIDDMYFSSKQRIYIISTYLHALLFLVCYQGKDLA